MIRVLVFIAALAWTNLSKIDFVHDTRYRRKIRRLPIATI